MLLDKLKEKNTLLGATTVATLSTWLTVGAMQPGRVWGDRILYTHDQLSMVVDAHPLHLAHGACHAARVTGSCTVAASSVSRVVMPGMCCLFTPLHLAHGA